MLTNLCHYVDNIVDRPLATQRNKVMGYRIRQGRLYFDFFIKSTAKSNTSIYFEQ